MQNPHTNPDDIALARGIAALREDPTGEAPEAFVAQVIAGKPAAPTNKLRLRAAIGLAFSLGIAATLMWPKTSPAEDLKRVVGKMGVRDVLCHQKDYTIFPDGRRVLISEMFAKGKRVRVINYPNAGSTGGGQMFDGQRVVSYYPSQGWATSQASNIDADNLAPDRSIQFVLSSPWNRSIEKQSAIHWNGRLADKYVVKFEFVDGRKQVQRGALTLYADPQTDRPLYEEAHYDSMAWRATEWDYPQNSDGLLALSLPPGTPIYDITLQREQALSAVLTPMATDTVGGRTITLRGVYVDHRNSIAVIYSGGDGRPGFDWKHRDEASIKIEGIDQRLFGGTLGGNGRIVDGRYTYFPSTYRGLRILIESGDLLDPARIPDEFTIKVPIWLHQGAGENSPLRLAGFARFKVKHPVRTASFPEVLAPANLSIFDDDYAAKTKPAESGQASNAG